MMLSDRPNCTPCKVCGRCTGCGVQMVINRTRERFCKECGRSAGNGARLGIAGKVRAIA